MGESNVQQIVASPFHILDGCGGMYYSAARLYKREVEFHAYPSEVKMVFDLDRVTESYASKKLPTPYAVVSNLDLVIEAALDVLDEVIVNDEIVSIKGTNETDIAYYVHYDLKLDQFYKRQLCTSRNELALWMQDKSTGLITCRSFLPEVLDVSVKHEKFISKKFYICKV